MSVRATAATAMKPTVPCGPHCYRCHHPRCDGGLCVFYECDHPTCRGGACEFLDTKTPRALQGKTHCKGGRCLNDGVPMDSNPTEATRF